jgi:hypothetical protein
LSIDVPLERLDDRPAALKAFTTATVYRIHRPFEHVPDGRLVLETGARVFKREVIAGVLREPTRSRRDAWFDQRANAIWVHANQNLPAPSLALDLPRADTSDVFVIVDDGDNPPLAISRARLLLPSYRVRFFRPANTRVQLAYGNRDLEPPHYDLALLASQLFGASATELQAGPERDVQGPGANGSSPISPWIFWTVLGLAVAALLVVITRLVRKPAA